MGVEVHAMGLFAAFLLLTAGTQPASIEGQWLTEDRKGVVQIAPCGGQMC